MRVVMIGPFGLRPKSAMSTRALPLTKALVARGQGVALLLPHLVIPCRLVHRALALRTDVIHCFEPKTYPGLTTWVLWWFQRVGLTHARLGRLWRMK